MPFRVAASSAKPGKSFLLRISGKIENTSRGITFISHPDRVSMTEFECVILVTLLRATDPANHKTALEWSNAGWCVWCRCGSAHI